jgi:hypothetical protein
LNDAQINHKNNLQWIIFILYLLFKSTYRLAIGIFRLSLSNYEFGGYIKSPDTVVDLSAFSYRHWSSTNDPFTHHTQNLAHYFIATYTGITKTGHDPKYFFIFIVF